MDWSFGRDGHVSRRMLLIVANFSMEGKVDKQCSVQDLRLGIDGENWIPSRRPKHDAAPIRLGSNSTVESQVWSGKIVCSICVV